MSQWRTKTAKLSHSCADNYSSLRSCNFFPLLKKFRKHWVKCASKLVFNWAISSCLWIDNGNTLARVTETYSGIGQISKMECTANTVKSL